MANNGLHHPASVHQYEMIKKTATPYESLSVRSVATGHQQQDYPPPPSDSSDVETLLAHQNVIANTHADGSYFMTPEGTYVQLVNGILTNVEFQPSPPASVTYSQLQFSEQNLPPTSLNTYPANYHQVQSLPAMGSGQPQPQPFNTQLSIPVGAAQLNTQTQQVAQNQNNSRQAVLSPQQPNLSSQLMSQAQSLTGSLTSSHLSQAPTVSHLSQASTNTLPGENHVDSKSQDNTRMNMRIQRDMANMAGMKCSQF